VNVGACANDEADATTTLVSVADISRFMGDSLR